MTEGELMFAAALLNAAVCRSNAQIEKMRVDDMWALQNPGAKFHSDEEYANALDPMVHDVQIAINTARSWGS